MVTQETLHGRALHAVLSRHIGAGQFLFGVVDAARDKELAYIASAAFGCKTRWLFRDAGAHMLAVAPYLVPVPYSPTYPFVGCGYLNLWAARLGTSAGIFIVSNVYDRLLHSHLQRCFQVTSPAGDASYFRFYDPRVLRAFLPTCSAAEVDAFLGPIDCLIVESQKSDQLQICRRGSGGIAIQIESLAPPPHMREYVLSVRGSE